MRRSLIILIGTFILQACGSSGSESTSSPPPKPAKDDKKEEAPEDDQLDADLIKIRKPREIRRAYIALTHSLPSPQTVIDYTAGTLGLEEQVRNLVYSSSFAETMTAELIEVWKMGLDFARGRQDINSAMIPGFSAAIAEKIHGELRKLIYFHLEQNTPYPLWFSHSYSVMHKDLVDDANFTALRQLYPGDDYLIGAYSDNRFQSGILTSNAVRMLVGRSRLLDNNAAASKILQTFFCSHQDQAEAHNFLKVHPNDLSSPGSLSQTHASCAQCHRDAHALARHLPMASGDDSIAQWFNISANQAFDSATLFSQPFSKASELKNILSSDSRLGSCLIKNLVKIYFHRDFGDEDQKLLSGLYASYEEHQQLRDLALYMSSDKTFFTGLTLTELKRNKKLKARVLSRLQLKAILKSLYPLLNLTEPNLALLAPNAGSSLKDRNEFAYGELIQMRDYARQWADQIVESELDGQKSAAQRRLLTGLSDGLVPSETSKKIEEQILALHYQLTGLKIESSSERYKGLKKLWDTETRTDAAGFKKGWKVVLMAILLSSDFLIY